MSIITSFKHFDVNMDKLMKVIKPYIWEGALKEYKVYIYDTMEYREILEKNTHPILK